MSDAAEPPVSITNPLASSETNQVTVIVEAAKERMKFKKAYNVKAATALGIVHIVCGFIALGTGTNVMVNGPLDTSISSSKRQKNYHFGN